MSEQQTAQPEPAVDPDDNSPIMNEPQTNPDQILSALKTLIAAQQKTSDKLSDVQQGLQNLERRTDDMQDHLREVQDDMQNHLRELQVDLKRVIKKAEDLEDKTSSPEKRLNRLEENLQQMHTEVLRAGFLMTANSMTSGFRPSPEVYAPPGRSLHEPRSRWKRQRISRW